MNRELLHELLDKTFQEIDTWMGDIPLIQEANKKGEN